MSPPHHSWGGGSKGRRGWPGLTSTPPHSWGGGPKGRRGWPGLTSTPPHSWGGGPKGRRGWPGLTSTPPIHGEVARRAGGAGQVGADAWHRNLLRRDVGRGRRGRPQGPV